MFKGMITASALGLALFAHGCHSASAASVGAQDNRDGRAKNPMLTQPAQDPAQRPKTPTENANPGLKPYPHDPINRSGHSEPRWFLVMSKPVGADSSLTRFITHFATQAECQKALQEYDNQSGYPMGCREVSTWVVDD